MKYYKFLFVLIFIGLISCTQEENDLIIKNNHHSAWHYDYFLENGVPDKPMINVEIFGGWTRKFMPPGVYPREDKDLHTREIDVSLVRSGLQVHFHSNPWCQGPSMGNYPIRFDLGGNGTTKNPGIQWWFDYLARSTKVQE